jgi:O-acetyl-ADP-ribose deacetylase (regulator of RNase III)
VPSMSKSTRTLGSSNSYYSHMEIELPGGKKIRVMIGDITKIPVDAMVNAANSGLRGGGGVDGAIHRAGGPSIMRELAAIRMRSGGCPTGSAVATGAGALPAKHVFHAVGPIYRDGRSGEAEQLASCYRKCMELAALHDVRTISFPAISTGVYGYPLDEAAAIAMETIVSRLQDSPVGEALLVLFDQRAYDVYRARASALGNAGS